MSLRYKRLRLEPYVQDAPASSQDHLIAKNEGQGEHREIAYRKSGSLACHLVGVLHGFSWAFPSPQVILDLRSH